MVRSINPALREQWRARMSRYSGCELTVAEFCRLEEVSQASFYQWRKKLQTGSAGASDGSMQPDAQRGWGSFVSVVPVGGGSHEDVRRDDVVVLVLGNGVRVEVPCCEPALVERVVLTAGQHDGPAAEGRE